MNLDELRSFARRDWDAVERSKRDYWAMTWRERGPALAMEAWWSLWQRVRATQPAWPDDLQRAEDLAHHVELARKLALARHVATR